MRTWFGVVISALSVLSLASCQGGPSSSGAPAPEQAVVVESSGAPTSSEASASGSGVETTPSAADGATDEAALAKAAQNPVADLISVPIQNNFNFGVGPDDDMQYIMNIQPVIPTKLSENWNLINRVIMPVIYQPSMGPGMDSEFGLGDIQYQAFFSPAKPGKLIWGVGPVFQFPTATDDVLGADKWCIGGGAVALKSEGPWVYGALANNIWSVGGSGPADVNQMLIQPFVNYNMDDGWYISTAPILTANWEANSSNRWTIPIGAGVGKITRLGKLPLNIQLAAYYNVEHPSGGADWQLRFQVQFLFPKGKK